jgi:predicted GNAT superfamily acetyltransferase
MSLEIKVAGPADFPELLALNEACVPHVNSIGEPEIAMFSKQAHRFSKVVEDGALAGFVIALTRGVAYESENYQWFCREIDEFLYIDRIMVHSDFRRRGVASLLYQYLEQVALDDKLQRLCCEVNLVPPNPDSLQLHFGLGFVQQATQKTGGGAKEVSLLVKELGNGDPID